MNRKSIGVVLGALAALYTLPVLAQHPDNPECLGSECGKPKEEGGGCGCGCGCSVWVAFTDDGKTLAYTDDADGDGKSDDGDNCPFATNRDQLDDDGDGVGNACDNCVAAINASQLDIDGDHLGDACDSDADGDSVPDTQDTCALIPNSSQLDTDGDHLGDACDSDDDGDGIPDVTDNCPAIPNPEQQDMKGDARCNADADRDGINDARDNCPASVNANQLDTDGDGLGDVCDLDIDNDGVADKDQNGAPTFADNCPTAKNRNQWDDDGDGLGDLCDPKYCVVVDSSNPADCLDPNSPFTVSGGGSIMLKAGEKFRLPLFANRNGAAIQYVWTVKQRPAGSAAAIENPTGVTSLSRHWAYAYTDGNVPSFTADVDGAYVLQLQGSLAVADRAYPDKKESTSELRMTAARDGFISAVGCNAVPVDASTAGLALALLALIRRKRQQE